MIDSQIIPICSKCQRPWEKTVPLAKVGSQFLCGICLEKFMIKLKEEQNNWIQENLKT